MLLIWRMNKLRMRGKGQEASERNKNGREGERQRETEREANQRTYIQSPPVLANS